MTQRDRDRLVALKKAKKGAITQRQAAEEIGQTERHVRRLLKQLKAKGDKAVVHALRGRRSNRKLDEKVERTALEILSREVYAGFGPTLAAEYLAEKHGIHAGRETVRQWMIAGKLWRAQRQGVEKIHQWRPRRSREGELVQWDTSEHAWLEERGPKLYLIGMIDDASSRVYARFVLHDSTEENMRLLWSYVERYGRPVSYYTDKASLFQTAPKVARDSKQLPRDEQEPLPPTQIGRALRELGIVWIAAHSPQAKGRVERGNGTHQDRLVKKMGRKKICTHEAANAYLQAEYLGEHNARYAREPAEPQDYHRKAPPTRELEQVFCLETERSISNDWVVRYENRYFQLERTSDYPPRQAKVTVCEWEDGRVEIRYQGKARSQREIAAPEPKPVSMGQKKPPKPSPWKPAADHPWKTAGRMAAMLRATASAAP